MVLNENVMQGMEWWGLRGRQLPITATHHEFLEPAAPFIFGTKWLIVPV